MSYAEFYTQDSTPSHIRSKPTQDYSRAEGSGPRSHQIAQPRFTSPSVITASSSLINMPPRSYPTLDIPAAYSSANGHSVNGGGDELLAAAQASDQGHLRSPMIENPLSDSRSGSPGPPQPHSAGANGSYYTTLGLPSDRHGMGSMRNSLEPVVYSHGHNSIHHTPEPPHTPERGSRGMSINGMGYHGPSLKVIQWTPQTGDEGSQVTIILDALAINAAPSTEFSHPIFGVGSPAIAGPREKVTRRFVVLFGMSAAPTKFTRAQAIDGNGVGQSMSAGPNEDDAFVVLSTFVPARSSMGGRLDRIMVVVRVVDEADEIIEECIVGEWDPAPMNVSPVRYLKRPGDDLVSDRDSPALRSPGPVQYSPSRRSASFNTPQKGPPPPYAPRAPSPQYVEGEVEEDVPLPPLPSLDRVPPIAEYEDDLPQPDLQRTSQIPPAVTDTEGMQTVSNKAVLKLQGDLNQMAMGWSNEEWTNRRRLIQFWRQQEGNVINATFRPIPQPEFVPNSIVISCIFRDDWNECFVTSVDAIYLLEALVGVRFTVEEKNRIRRNLEGFKPMTVSKTKPDSEAFFKLIMGFPNPKPRNIEKDVKVFPWKTLAGALKKIIGKYSATYTAPLGHVPGVDDSGSGNEDGSGAAPPGPDGQRSRGSRATRRASPRMANGHPQSQPPPSPSVLSSPNPNVASQSLPPSPHIVQSPQQRGPHRFKAHYATARPGYEGYSGLGLAPSTYGSPQQAEGRSRINYSSGPAPHHEVYQNEETPASGAMGPPPSTLSHSRSWSEGPRRATSSGTYSMSGQYAFGNEYYAQDLAGVATTSGWAQGAHPTGNYDGPPIGTMLRRSSSLEGLRAAHNEYSQNASYER